MPPSICNKCQKPGTLLVFTSEDAHVNYYRCDACGHVWHHDKRDPAAPPVDVTVRPDDPKKTKPPE